MTASDERAPRLFTGARCDLAILAVGLAIHCFVLPHGIWGDAAYREHDLRELLSGRLGARPSALVVRQAIGAVRDLVKTHGKLSDWRL